jgi:hypothetical protein
MRAGNAKAPGISFERDTAIGFNGAFKEDAMTHTTTATLEYLRPTPDRPYTYMYPPPDGQPWQNASYQRAKRNYPQNLSFYAPAGDSEHQTGLAVDLWDGVTWSLPMAYTATGKRLFKHAHSYGFVLRYPNGKTKITGYHYEPWHYRYIGKADAMKFKGNSLTLEEYLGLA